MLWFANRGSGVVLVALLTLSTALGVIATVRAGSARWPRFATQTLHRNVSLLTMVMLVAHVVTAVLDEYVDLTWFDAFAPVAGKYAAKNRLSLTLASIAFDVLLVVVLSSLVRARLSHRFWRGLHLASYLSWAFGVLHGFLIGTDARTQWSIAVTVASVGVVAAAVIMRLATWAHERRLHADASSGAVLDGVR